MKTKIGICLTFILAAAFVISPGKGFTQSTVQGKDFIPKVEKIINKAVEQELFSGVVLIAKEGKVLFSKAYGEANRDRHIKNTLNTKFDICSIGKIFTSTSIMLLAQKGLLKISDPVIKYLPDFPFGNKITIHHLLTHTAGFGNFFSIPEYWQSIDKMRSVNAVLPLIYKQKLEFETPGEKWQYSNSGIVVLGAVIEKVSGIAYNEFIQKNIFGPLKMKESGLIYPEDKVENRSIGYIKNNDGSFKNNIGVIPPASPAGGLLTTANDLLIFDQALYSNSLLNQEYKKIMFTPLLNNYACCWMVENKYNNNTVGHSGGAPGANSMFRRYLNDKYTIIILSNYDRGTQSVFAPVEAAVLGKE